MRLPRSFSTSSHAPTGPISSPRLWPSITGPNAPHAPPGMPLTPLPLVTAHENRIIDLRLIVITDRQVAAPRSVEWVVGEALAAGAPAFQLRDKHASSAELVELALRLRKLTERRGALLFINDRLDIATAVGADGAHLGP